MKILLCHNFYQQAGGEDRVFEDESWLLRSRGHDVQTWTVHNDDIRSRSKLQVAAQTIWNRRSAAHVAQLVQRERYDVVHFHNTFPLMSPAVWSAARGAGAAVVQTLHNFRLICPKATLHRGGQVCTQCVGRAVPWPALRYRCYRDSGPATATVAGMLGVHRWRGTYERDVDCYIALSEIASQWFVRGGLPAERIAVKPNFVREAPAAGDGSGGFLLFVGRLSPEKGIDVLCEAWRRPQVTARLKIVGDGPLADAVRTLAAELPHVEWLGAQPAGRVQELMQQAAGLVLPSTWFEGFPKTLVESYSVGTPVLASRLGAFEELVAEGRTGRLFDPGSADSLAQAVVRIQSAPHEFHALRGGTRAEFESLYTAERNYDQLLDIYGQALARRRASRTAREPAAALSRGDD